MFEPVRGGTRGGQAEFKWSDVSADKDRENYLGHSINAPTGRWQKNKDIHWYNRDVSASAEERAEEIRKIKEAEAEALAAALGFGPSQKGGAIATAGPTTGANAVPTGDKKPSDAELQKALEKEEKRKRKAERKAEKQARKEQRRAEKSRSKRDEDDSSRERDHGRQRDRWRLRSPLRRPSKDVDSRDRRYRSPRSLSPEPRRHTRERDRDYDVRERELERERDRRRWDDSRRREAPSQQHERY